ncbi:hypothetical protein [Phenylobacterium sp.]|uniref:hypothetical protein n=1 Tax=Phenylobacterium sp. TaxID=1871053 RepID=UPI002F3E24DC
MNRDFALCVALVAALLAGCNQYERKTHALCGQPPGVEDTHRKEALDIEGKLKAAIPMRGSAGAEGKFVQSIQRTSTQIFRSTGESGFNRAREITEYRSCALLAADDSISGERKAILLVELKERIQESADKVRKDKQDCFDAKFAAEKAASIIPYEKTGGADAAGPGWKGGKNKGEETVCATIPPGYQPLGPTKIEPISCHGGRCSDGPITTVKAADGSTNICMKVKAWSESNSGGGGGSRKIRLFGEAERPITKAQTDEMRAACGL